MERKENGVMAISISELKDLLRNSKGLAKAFELTKDGERIGIFVPDNKGIGGMGIMDEVEQLAVRSNIIGG